MPFYLATKKLAIKNFCCWFSDDKYLLWQVCRYDLVIYIFLPMQILLYLKAIKLVQERAQQNKEISPFVSQTWKEDQIQ